jgi:hypothetical protein
VTELRVMGKDRLAAFSDGVVAIIITIMVLELKVPHGGDWKVLLGVTPSFVSYERAVGVMVLLLTLVVLLTPVPLSNIAPAIVISLISLAYVEQDGLLLSIHRRLGHSDIAICCGRNVRGSSPSTSWCPSRIRSPL